MESHEVLRKAFEEHDASPKEIAAALGVSLSLVYKWAQPSGAQPSGSQPSGSPSERTNGERGSGSRNPLDRVEALVALTGDPDILEWLCQRAGGYFVRNPRSSCDDGYEVVPATHHIVQRFAGLLDVVSRAAQDNSITADESEEIRRVWDRLKAYCEGFVRCCEEGDFEQIQKELNVP